ncbi:MAG: winged helix-turn-helix domain-containing protein [Thermoplasmatota archaeon]
MGRKSYDAHDAVGETLKFITSSKVRTKIMLGLQEQPKTSSVLRDEIGASASSVIHAARDLEKEDLLVEKEDGYHLTSVGSVVAAKLEDTIYTMDVLDRGKDFWLTHNLGAIPEPFLSRLHEIGDFEILTSSVRNIFKTLTVYKELTKQARMFQGVSPIFVDAFVPLVKKLLANDATVQLVVTGEVLEELVDFDREGFGSIMENDNLSIWRLDETVEVAFTVTDSILALGLFGQDGIYDAAHDLVSRDKGAINWGRELFKYYKSRARLVVLEDI